MDGESSYCGSGNIDLVINNVTNLKWNSSVSAKAGYFCHKRHIRQLENIDTEMDGGERGGMRQCFLGAWAAWVGEGRFHHRDGVQCKFSASPDQRTLNETPYKFSIPLVFWQVIAAPPASLYLALSFLSLFPFSIFLIFIIILLDSWELFSSITKQRYSDVVVVFLFCLVLTFFLALKKLSGFLLSWKKNKEHFFWKQYFSLTCFST